jgi:aminoglycoside/choline kinase family phosphotransferase
MNDYLKYLGKAFKNWSGEDPLSPVPLPSSGSERKYWRLTGDSASAIGVYHPVKEESRAFQKFTDHFLKLGLNVPEIYFIDPERDIYLLQDLGNTTLFSLLQERQRDLIPDHIIALYKTSLEKLIHFQVKAKEGLDFSVCYPRNAFDRQSIVWDLNYFKYNFLKLEASFNEQKLENDFQQLTDYLLEVPRDFFMYRDFQARNIMIYDETPYFIDYQGGRKGPLQYDPVSLLYQVKANLPFSLREELLYHYINCLQKETNIDKDHFLEYVDGFILLRLLQVLGAYGFRGLIQKRSHFISSLPFAVKNIQWFIENNKLPIALPELLQYLKEIAYSDHFSFSPENRDKGLAVSIKSFSYKNGVPEDLSGHGGGFVFDCRALPNPGRDERFRSYTGKDSIISEYFGNKSVVSSFIENVYSMVDQSVENYMERGFDHLSVNFGCTGGQHRSVFCAETLAEHLKNKFPDIFVTVVHREL